MNAQIKHPDLLLLLLEAIPPDDIQVVPFLHTQLTASYHQAILPLLD
jgi:hypothetical protein